MQDSELPDLDALFSGGLSYSVTDCPRCEGDHMGLVFQPFSADADFTHWAMCPKSKEPLMMNIEVL